MSDTSLRRAKRLARALDASELHQMHDVLIIYNGMVVTLTAAFMSLTQDKIIRSFHARAFLEQLSSVPLPPVSGFFTSVGAASRHRSSSASSCCAASTLPTTASCCSSSPTSCTAIPAATSSSC